MTTPTSRVRAAFLTALAGFCFLSTSRAPIAPEAVAVRLWEDPGLVASRDLFWGSGSRQRQPDPPFRFIAENTGGTQPKLVVMDRKGVMWDMKLGPEAHAEVAASRIVWALGYLVDEAYFVREGRIDHLEELDRAAGLVNEDGAFQNARFERRDHNKTRLARSWTFHDNPFAGRRELSGLQIAMAFVNNWDIDGGRNNQILEVEIEPGRIERWYMVSDLGGSFGKMGGLLSGHSKWNLADFLEEGFIEAATEHRLALDYDGLEGGIDKVPMEHARWFAALAAQLTESQLRAAFESAGATPQEREGFMRKLMEKIRDLQVVTGLTR